MTTLPQTFYTFFHDPGATPAAAVGSSARSSSSESAEIATECPPILPELASLPRLLYIDGTLICPPLNAIPKANQLHELKHQKIYSDWITQTRLYLNTLSFKQKKSLYLYQSSYYQNLNDFVRKSSLAYPQEINYEHIGDTLEIDMANDEKEIKALAATLIHIIHNAPKPQGPLYAYRGSTSRLGRNPSFTSNQFLSFSMNPMGASPFNQDGNYMYRVELGPHVPHLLSIAAWNDRQLESEIVFPPGIRFEYEYTIPETPLPFDPTDFNDEVIYSPIVCLKVISE